LIKDKLIVLPQDLLTDFCQS